MVNANLEEEESFLFSNPHYHLSLHDIKQHLQRQLCETEKQGEGWKYQVI